ncbi:MAG: helix-turn-helix transcriptional regulator [Pedobacter sp.]|uniref:helix-turn-helix domain-containing protein n=1 Tax=Pedobacter sp. TaxID=1411316 RepID=UPI003565EE81
MSDLIRNIIGRNVKSIRKSLNLSLLNFSILTGISKASIVNIESGKKGYNLNLLDSILSFTTYTLKELSTQNLVVPYDLREKLLELYKNDLVTFNLLSQTPEIGYAVSAKLLPSTFLKTPKEIGQIKTFFEEFGWIYLGTSISNVLKGMPDSIEIRKHETKKNTNVYLKKQ